MNPADISEKAKNIVLSLLPFKSREQYEKEYELFSEWKTGKGVVVVNKEVILTYLHEKSQSLAPPSIWSKYSMLKATLNVKENIDIGAFSKVLAFLKRNGVGYEPKKSKVLTRDEVNRFLKEADDKEFLLIKVALLIGICGACRREELHSLRVGDIVDDGSALFITVKAEKTHSRRTFSITADGEAVNALELCRKYTRLRSEKVKHDYFFVSYRNQKCTVQRVGIHSFGKMPSIVAKYLKLPNSELYTGHCFRRTSATLVAETGADFVTLKRLGGWRSSSTAEGYIEDSLEKKRKVSKLILGEKDASTSINRPISSCKAGASTSTPSSNLKPPITTVNEENDRGFLFSGNSFQFAKNCKIHVHITK